MDGAQLIVQKITDNLDTRPGFEDDFVRKDVNPDTVRDTEILVGLTNRTASQEAYAKLSEHEFILTVSGGKLVVIGYTADLTRVAAEVLVEKYMTDGYKGAVTSVTMYDTAKHQSSQWDKLLIPGGVEVTITMVKNNDNTITLSYEMDLESVTDTTGIQDGVTL
ncbi:MAG: hypothetical protein IKI93_15660, partial [Clostridia bacterium]|nr:hypothetical protein [Clostridia bacterium]